MTNSFFEKIIIRFDNVETNPRLWCCRREGKTCTLCMLGIILYVFMCFVIISPICEILYIFIESFHKFPLHHLPLQSHYMMIEFHYVMEPRGWLLLFGNFNLYIYIYIYHVVVHFGLPTVTQSLLLTQKKGGGGVWIKPTLSFKYCQSWFKYLEIFVLIYPFIPKGTMGCKYGLITHNYIHEC
jgi:hypothetical protein